MENLRLIAKIKTLKAIRPREEWVLETKNTLFSDDYELSPRRASVFGNIGRFFQASPVLRPTLVIPALLVIVGAALIFWFSLQSVPGEPLHSIERLAETGQGAFLSWDKTEFQLTLAEKRVRELREIAQRNDIDNLAPALKEYQEDLKKAVASLDDGPRNPSQALKIAQKVNQISKETKAVEEALQIAVGSEEVAELKSRTMAYLAVGIEETKGEIAQIVEREIEALRESSLTESQQALLEEAEAAFERGDYETALEKILRSGEER